MRLLACLLGLPAALGCGPDQPDEAFGFVGEVADQFEAGSSVGLWVVSSTPPEYYFKLGNGSSVGNQFDISFEIEPPPEAINEGGVGVSLVGLLPGLATVADGVVEFSDLRLIGLTTNHAVIFKATGATGPAWSQRFPTGFSCARCIRVTDALDEFEPTLCALVVIEATFADPCAWY